MLRRQGRLLWWMVWLGGLHLLSLTGVSGALWLIWMCRTPSFLERDKILKLDNIGLEWYKIGLRVGQHLS